MTHPSGHLPPTAAPGWGGVIAGVDEAGLGPLVGPLTIGYSVLHVPRPGADPWRLLRRTVSDGGPAARKRDDRRLVVADSKRVFSRNPRGGKRLESTALSFLALLWPECCVPRDPLDVLFHRFPTARERIGSHPWYARLPELPLFADRPSVELSTELLRRDMQDRGCALLDAGIRLVPAGELNESFSETANKSLSVWAKTLEVLRHLWDAYGAAAPRVTVDILGGRLHYGPLLARGFPDAVCSWSREVSGHAAYRLEGREGATRRHRMWLEFRVRGEEHSFPTALGSCLAKYGREVVMHAFNAYFAELDPELRPTAGYRTDGNRWLRDASGLVERIDRRVLIRER